MAKCIKCSMCGLVFLSGEEVQTHADMTGHSEYEESDEPPTVWQCVTCKKPCRSLVEKDIHCKRTGHEEYTETTLTEAKVNVVKDFSDMQEENKAEALADLQGLVGAEKIAAMEKAAAQAAEKKAQEEDKLASEPLVPPEVDAQLLAQLKDMGFGENRAVRALYEAQDAATLDRCVEWLADRADDDTLDEPLVVPQSKAAAKKPLTKEEKAAKIEELRIKNKAKREAQEKIDAIKREKERIESGKKMVEVKRLQEEQQMQRDLEQRRIEKQKDKEAKAEMQRQLREEKIERFKKAGRWTDQMEADYQAGRDPFKKNDDATGPAVDAGAEKNKRQQPDTPGGAAAAAPAAKKKLDLIREKVIFIKKNNAEAVWRTAIATCQIYVNNVWRNPNEDKYKTIKLTNKAFVSRVAPASGHLELLIEIGFVRTPLENGTDALRIGPQIPPIILEKSSTCLGDCLTNPFFGVL